MNKPVAWMHQNPDYAISKNWSQEYSIPLYTHPVKELTDEEILELWDWNSGEILATDLLDFADAILRKVKGDV